MDVSQPGAAARRCAGIRQVVTWDGRPITYFEKGKGAAVVLIASVGREASDFNELAQDISQAGYRMIAVAPPGTEGSAMPEHPMTLQDLANDVAAVLEHAGCPRAVVLGHAFGNRVARTFATIHEPMTQGTIVVAAGGKVKIDPAANEALFNCFDEARSIEQRTNDVRYAFFAGDNEIPDYWLRGWHAKTAQLQGAATRATPSEEWWAAGRARLLVIQGMQDRIAPPEHTADLLKAELGDRVSVVKVENAGHALLPEARHKISAAVLAFLERVADD